MHPHLNTSITYLNPLIRFLAPCIAYLNTLSRLHILKHELPILTHCVGFRLHILNTCIASLIHCPTIPYLITLPIYTLSYYIEPNTLGFRQFESSANQNRARKSPSTSSAKQMRVLRHPSRQPIRIEYYVTRELSARVEVLSGLSVRLGLLEPVLKPRVFNPPPLPGLLTPLLLTCLHRFLRVYIYVNLYLKVKIKWVEHLFFSSNNRQILAALTQLE